MCGEFEQAGVDAGVIRRPVEQRRKLLLVIRHPCYIQQPGLPASLVRRANLRRQRGSQFRPSRQQPDAVAQRSRAKGLQRAPQPGPRGGVLAGQGKDQCCPVSHNRYDK
jgi:hypothetical protein